MLKRLSITILILMTACGREPAPAEAPPAPPPLAEADRDKLAEYGLAVLDAHASKAAEPQAPALEGKAFEYDRVYATIYVEGRVRGCQSGRTGQLAPDIATAVKKAIEDARFGGEMAPEEAPKADLNLAWLHSRTQLPVGDLSAYEPGVHAIEVKKGKKRAFFKAEIPINKGYSVKKTLARLCKKAKLPSGCHKNADTEVAIYRTMTFHKKRGDVGTALFRGNPTGDPELTRALGQRRTEMALDWFKANINPDTGLLQYEYLPGTDKYSDDNNHVRQIASLWSITTLRAHLKDTDPALKAFIHKTLDHYLAEGLVKREDHAYIVIEGKGKLAYTAFMIQALLGAPEYPEADTLAASLAEGLLKQQKDSGEYDTYFDSDKNSGVEFYPGEAMLALMRLHKKTGEARYVDSVKRAFPHYRDYWRAKKNTPMLSWHSQTYRMLYEATEDPEVAAHTFELNDWLIDTYQVNTGPFPDQLGGFSRKGRPTISSATYLEGLNDAYALAKALKDEDRIKKYKLALQKGTRFVLRLQYTEKNSFHLKRPERALGGFRHSLTLISLRNDNTQHAGLMLIKALDNGIFE